MRAYDESGPIPKPTTCGHCGTACQGQHFGRTYDGTPVPMIWLEASRGALVTPDAMDAMIAAGRVTVISRTVDALTVRHGDCDELDHFRLVRDVDYV